MITITKPTYKCEHCKKLYQSAKWCEKHEIACNKNPANWRACGGCTHCDAKTATVMRMHSFLGHEVETEVEAYFCNEYKHFLYPPKVEHLGKPYETIGFKNLPMPKDCDQGVSKIFNS